MERTLKGKGEQAKAPNKHFQRYFHDDTCHQITWWFGREILASSQIRYALLHEVVPNLSLWKNCLFQIPIAFNFNFHFFVFLPFYLYYIAIYVIFLSSALIVSWGKNPCLICLCGPDIWHEKDIQYGRVSTGNEKCLLALEWEWAPVEHSQKPKPSPSSHAVQ